jgi:MFS family permease
MNSAKRWQRNLMLMNVISFFRTFMVIMPIFVPLMQKYGLSMQETMILQSTFAGVTLLLELPSGYIADLFGRKGTMMIGFALAGCGFSQVLWADTFWELVVFEMTLGVAMSLISGADMSLAYESEKALNNKTDQHAIGRMISWLNFGEAVAGLSAFVLLKFDINWLLWMQAAVGWLPLILSFGLTEPPSNKADKTPKHMGAALSIIKQNPILVWLTSVFVIAMSTTYLIAWLNQSLWLETGLSIEYFGLFWGFLGLTVGITARYSSRVPDHIGSVTVFSLLAALLFVGYLALTSGVLTIVIFGAVCVSAFRGIAAPKMRLRINNVIDNDYRATINSLVAACFRVSTLFLGPLMGFAVDSMGAVDAAPLLIILVLPAMGGLVSMNKLIGVRNVVI